MKILIKACNQILFLSRSIKLNSFSSQDLSNFLPSTQNWMCCIRLYSGPSSFSEAVWTASWRCEWRFLCLLCRDSSQDSQRVEAALFCETTAWKLCRRTLLQLMVLIISAAVLNLEQNCSSGNLSGRLIGRQQHNTASQHVDAILLQEK